jgi:hypothetical protein
VTKYSDLDQGANSVLSGMQYPHWLMVAGAVLVVLGFVGFAFRQNRNIELDDKPTEMETNGKE